MRILDRLVATTFLKLFVLFLMAAPWLFILGDVTENLDTYIDRGLTGMDVARAYVFQLPLFFQWSFPAAALLAAVFTVHSMTTHREIVAAKAGGISFHRIIRPILVLGVLLTGAALSLTDLVPKANRIAGQILRNEDPRRSWRSDFAYRSEQGTTWQVARVTVADRRMTDVILERPATEASPAQHVQAAGAVWDSADGWTFQRGYLRHLRHDSTVWAGGFESMRLVGVTERPEDFLGTTPEEEEMTYQELARLSGIIERTGGNARELLVKKEQKLSIPVATLVVILFGAPLATSSRRGGTAYGIGVSLGTTILYTLLLKFSGALGEAGTLSPLWAAWSPNVLFFVAGVTLLSRVRT